MTDAGPSLAVPVEPMNHEREMAHGNVQVGIQILTKLQGNQCAILFDAESMEGLIPHDNWDSHTQHQFDSIWVDI